MPIKPKILIADDEPIIADTLATILNQAGFDARAAYSGSQALEVASKFAPDMLVSDVIMPDLNGIETAVLMRSLLPQIKVLLFSGQAAAADLLVQARTSGYEFELLAKPVHPKDLLKKLQEGGINPALPAAAKTNALRQAAQQKWIEIAPGDLPVEPVGSSSEEN